MLSWARPIRRFDSSTFFSNLLSCIVLNEIPEEVSNTELRAELGLNKVLMLHCEK